MIFKICQTVAGGTSKIDVNFTIIFFFFENLVFGGFFLIGPTVPGVAYLIDGVNLEAGIMERLF